jgi:hypothetical protein
MMAGNELEKTLKKDLQEFTVRDADNVMGFLVHIPNIISYAIKNNQVAETKKVLVKTCDILRKLDAMKSIPKPLAYMMCSPAYLDDDALRKHLYDVWDEYCDSGLADIVNEIVLLNKKCYAKVDKISFYGPPTMTIYPGNNKKYVWNCYSSLMFERVMETGEMPSFTKVGYKGFSRSVEYDEKTGRMIKDIFPGKIFAEDYYKNNKQWFATAKNGPCLSDFEIKLLYLANKEAVPICAVGKSGYMGNTLMFLYANLEHKSIVQNVMSIDYKKILNGVFGYIRNGYAYKNKPQIVNDFKTYEGYINVEKGYYIEDRYDVYKKNKYLVIKFPIYKNEFYRIPVNDMYPQDFISQLFFPVIEREARKVMRKIELVEELPDMDR